MIRVFQFAILKGFRRACYAYAELSGWSQLHSLAGNSSATLRS
jgi:hypothetical protein